jgi:hypothetical protein
MAATKDKGPAPKCEAEGTLPTDDYRSESGRVRCPLCTAQPKLKADGTIKSHEKKSPRAWK